MTGPSDNRPSDLAVVDFLRSHHGAEPSELEVLSGGFWSAAIGARRRIRTGATNGSGAREAAQVLVIDAANVIGSRPTGWWRDRPGAARVFTERVRAAVSAGRLSPPVIIVLEGRARAGA